MSDIIKLEELEDFKMYSPILVLNEDIYFDNRFCVLNTNMGNIAFSYYELGIAPSVVIENKILFLSFGVSCYVINLVGNKLLYQSNGLASIVFEIVKCSTKSCVVFVGELSLLCFSIEGLLMWKNSYRNIIFDWRVTDEGIFVELENGEKMLVSFENGNGVSIT